MSKLHRAFDLVEDLIEDTEHLINMLEVLEMGFYNDHNDCKDCEISSLFIISKYIELVQYRKLKDLCEILDGMR